MPNFEAIWERFFPAYFPLFCKEKRAGKVEVAYME